MKQEKLEIIAKLELGWNGKFTSISIKKNGEEFLLDADESNRLFAVLCGKEGCLYARKKGEYQPSSGTYFTCSEPIRLESTGEEDLP